MEHLDIKTFAKYLTDNFETLPDEQLLYIKSSEDLIEKICIYILHYVSLNNSKTIMVLSKSFNESKQITKTIMSMYNKLPVFLRPALTGNNSCNISFANGNCILCRKAEENSLCGLSINFLIINDKIKNKQQLWQAISPCISYDNAKCIIIL